MLALALAPAFEPVTLSSTLAAGVGGSLVAGLFIGTTAGDALGGRGTVLVEGVDRGVTIAALELCENGT